MMIDGRWDGAWHPTRGATESGRFQRWDAAFRNWITPDGRPGPTGDGGFAAESGRYHLIVAYACPWASRTLMVRKLKGLTEHIGVSFAQAEWSDEGWRIDDTERAGLAAAGLDVEYVHQIYSRADPAISGRASVPVLWDKHRQTIVNSESADILRMLGSAFAGLVEVGPDLYPEDLRESIDALNTEIYRTLNNGVYRAGFAASQPAYAEAFRDVFTRLDALESRLGDGGPFLFGHRLTEADIRLFVTLVRFDVVYYSLFKCNLRRLVDYDNLYAYARRIFEIPGVAETVNIDHIKRNYYSNRAANPNGIVPIGPEVAPGARLGRVCLRELKGGSTASAGI